MNHFFQMLTAIIISTSSVYAASSKIISCQTNFIIGENFYSELYLDSQGQMQAMIGETPATLHPTSQAVLQKIDSSNDTLDYYRKALAQTNNHQPTGIDPQLIHSIQEITLEGNSDFSLNLVKLFDLQNNQLGWLVRAAASISGCY